MIEHAKQFYNRVEEDMVEHLAETWVDPAERDYPV
jgi:hypothetical protein